MNENHRSTAKGQSMNLTGEQVKAAALEAIDSVKQECIVDSTPDKACRDILIRFERRLAKLESEADGHDLPRALSVCDCDRCKEIRSEKRLRGQR